MPVVYFYVCGACVFTCFWAFCLYRYCVEARDICLITYSIVLQNSMLRLGLPVLWTLSAPPSAGDPVLLLLTPPDLYILVGGTLKYGSCEGQN